MTAASARDRVLLEDLRALTFVDGEWTAARRGDPRPQLSCHGSACRTLRPRAVQCVQRGNLQWKCEAQLPSSYDLGTVHVSCEGWDRPDDAYILRGSCALEYELVRSSGTHASWPGLVVMAAFWAVALWIVLSFLHVYLGKEVPKVPSGDTDAPPPYSARERTFESPVTRMLAAVGLGTAAAYLFRSAPSPTYSRQPDYVPGMYGTMGAPYMYGHDGLYHDRSHGGPSTTTHTSVGFGGTDVR